MPYDLVVRGFTTVPFEQVLDYARDAPWIEIDGDAEGALVTNTDTGVYITLAPENGELLYAVHYQRPRFFAREALLFASALMQAYHWQVYDRQRQCEMRGNEADVAEAFAAWERLNAQQERRTDTIPIDAYDATSAWRWNYERSRSERRAESQGNALHVPRIFYVKAEGIRRARTAVFFPHEARNIVLPAADYLVYRDERGDRHIIDREQLLNEAAYYVKPSAGFGGAPQVEAPRFSLLLSALEHSKRGPFRAAILASDMLGET